MLEETIRVLNAHMDKEIERTQSLYGPHRDDLSFKINDIDVQTYGSQGQQRTTALSVKLAEIELINQEIESIQFYCWTMYYELDDYRQTHLLTTIQHKVQTL